MGWQDDQVISDSWKADEVVAPEKAPTTALNMVPNIGAAETAASLGTGAVAMPIAGLSGIGVGIAKALGITDKDPAEVVRKIQHALTYEPKSDVGKTMTDIVGYLPQKLAEGGDAAGQKVVDVTGSPLLGTAVSTGIQMAPAAVSKIAGKAKSALQAAEGEAVGKVAIRNAQRAEANARIQAYKDAGLNLPPTKVNPSLANKTLEGVSGAPKLSTRQATMNQEVINNLVREDLGIPPEIPLSKEALSAVRSQASKKYEAIKGVGEIKNDAQYFKDLDTIYEPFKATEKAYPHRAENPLKGIINGLKRDNVDAAAAVEEVKLLRGDADAAAIRGDKNQAKALRGAAEAVDSAIDRHLKSLESPELANAVAEYQAARKTIAKTYTAEKALQGTNIDPQSYARAAKKVPLDGNAKLVADFATDFKDVAKIASKGDTLGFGDVMTAGGAQAVTGSPLGALGIFGRPGIRALMTSKAYQDAMVKPRLEKTGGARRSLIGLANLQADPAITLAEIAAEKRE